MEKEISIFLNLMQSELDNNSHKGNWKEFKDVNKILLELEWHKSKLYVALKTGDKNDIKELIADCANTLMFLANATDTLEI